jgi:hypothetical protein
MGRGGGVSVYLLAMLSQAPTFPIGLYLAFFSSYGLSLVKACRQEGPYL